MNFSSPYHLMVWLTTNGIELSHWGSGTAKSVVDLWHEVQAGESYLQSAPLLRRVEVASLSIVQNGFQLFEAIQYFHDGRERYPNRAPSEKMKRGETPIDAAMRCLAEEIGCTFANILDPPKLIQTKEDQLDSPSYPGLPSLFTLHTLICTVQALPNIDFVTTNQAEGDPVASIRWRWVEPGQLQPIS